MDARVKPAHDEAIDHDRWYIRSSSHPTLCLLLANRMAQSAVAVSLDCVMGRARGGTKHVPNC